MQRILISGTVGFIGSSIAESLLARGDRVVGFDNFANGYSEQYYSNNLKRLKNFQNSNLIEIDLLEKERLVGLIKNEPFDFFIHCAAKTGIRESVINPKIYYRTNVLGTENIVKIIKDHQPTIKSIVFSSSSVYGQQPKVPYVETLTPMPLSPYGKSKYQMELMLADLSKRYELPLIVIRPFSVYGPFGRQNMAPYLLFKAIRENRTFQIHGNNQNNQRDWTYIDDIVESIKLIMERGNFTAGEIYNLAKGEPLGIETFTKTIIKELNIDYCGLRSTPVEVYEVNTTWGNIKKAKSHFGYNPLIKFTEGIKKTLENFLQYE